jgi:alpha-L-fucosidase
MTWPQFPLTLAVLTMTLTQPSPAADLVRPTAEQAAWQDLEVGLFFHFDISVFTDAGEGDWPHQGHLDPAVYNPAKLDTDQWLAAAQDLGARYTVFVAKHCTGFLSWQSDLYPYGVKQSPWRGGKGDIVRDYVASCAKFGIKPGIYASVSANAHCDVSNPGLINMGKGGDAAAQAAYVKTCEQMMTELWGNYGPLTYVWFDGGALPPDKGGPDLVPILKRLQPHVVAFQGPVGTPAGNTRWCGNESGLTAYPTWSTVRAVGEEGPGHADGAIWQPPECDAPLRNHAWFWHPGQEGLIRSVDDLVEMYYQSVGRNGNLILNGNIDRDGLVPEADRRRLKEFGDEIRRRFGHPIAETSGHGEVVELDLAQPTVIDNLAIMEQITEGERIREYVVEGLVDGAWRPICHGTAVGHKRLERFEPLTVSRVRLRVTKSVAEPLIRQLAVYHCEPPTAPLTDRQWILKVGDPALHDVAATLAAGHQAWTFDGRRSYVSLGDLELGGHDFSFAAWVQPAGVTNRERLILSKDRSGVAAGQLRFYLGAGNKLGFILSGSGGDGAGLESPAGAVPAGGWSRVAVTRAGGVFTLYVDGKAVASKTADATLSHRNRLELRLGARYAAGGDGPADVFEGAIGQPQLWARAVAARELVP